jgi:hypothetical protein
MGMEVAMHIIPMQFDAIYNSLSVGLLTSPNEFMMTVKDTWVTDDKRFRVYITQLVTGGTLRTYGCYQ